MVKKLSRTSFSLVFPETRRIFPFSRFILYWFAANRPVNQPATKQPESQRVRDSNPDDRAESTRPGALFAKVRAQVRIGRSSQTLCRQRVYAKRTVVARSRALSTNGVRKFAPQIYGSP